MGTATWISLAVVVLLIVLLGLYLWVSYNSLVTLRARVDEAWADITAQLRKRDEYIPPLLETVEGHASHEKAVLAGLTTAREESLAATTPEQASAAENHMQQALKSLFTVTEGYPKLHAGPQLLQLQGDIAASEERIQASRRFYNGGVREFNTKVQVFPNRMFARRPGFGKREFFEASDVVAIAEPPRVQF